MVPALLLSLPGPFIPLSWLIALTATALCQVHGRVLCLLAYVSASLLVALIVPVSLVKVDLFLEALIGLPPLFLVRNVTCVAVGWV